MTYTLGVSHANRWMNCPGAPRMIRQTMRLGDTVDLNRNTGLDGHYVAEQVLKSNGQRAPREFVGELLPNGTLFTLDHAVAVGVYIRDVLNITQHSSEPLLVEDRNDLSWIAPGIVAIIDSGVYDTTSRHATVWDLKFGASARDPFHNWQMIGNGLALAYKYPDAQRIDLRIVQPNCYSAEPVVSWGLDVAELKTYGLQLRAGALRAQEPDAPVIPGTHCYGCRAAHSCPALRAYNERMGDIVRNAVNQFATPQNMTPQEISLELDVLNAAQKTLKVRKEAQDAYAFQQADKAAVSIPGYKLVSKRTQRKIANESTFVETARTFGYSDKLLYHQPKLLSPSQLENAGVDKSLVEMFSEKPDAGRQLAPMSDSRPATASTLLERFKSIRNQE